MHRHVLPDSCMISTALQLARIILHWQRSSFTKKDSLMEKLFNIFSLLSLVFIISEQMIVAFSTFFIINLGLHIGDESSILWFLCFVLSLTVVFIPRIFKYRCLVKARYRSFRHYLELYEKNLYSHPYLKTSRKFCGQKQAYFQNQLWQTISESYVFADDFVTTLLNVVFNVAAISFTLSRGFLLSYFCSAFLTAAGAFLFRKRIMNRSRNAQESQNFIQAALFSGWDTMLTGNAYNWREWKRSFEIKMKEGECSEKGYYSFRSFVSFILMAAGILPVVLVAARMLLSDGYDGIMLATAVSLPRHVSNIQYMNFLVEDFTAFAGLIAKLSNIRTSADAVKNPKSYQGKVDWKNISFTKGNRTFSFSSMDECISYFETLLCHEEKGRIAVRGENGSGKTTVMMLMKEHFSEKAYLYPNHTNLFFKEAGSGEYSTGEKVRADLSQLIESRHETGAILYLFDEWNANLDSISQKKTDIIIEQISRQSLVIETLNKDS